MELKNPVNPYGRGMMENREAKQMLDDLDIKRIRGRMLFDSGGNPAVEAEVILENGAQGKAAVSVFDEMNGEEEADYIREWLSEAILFEDAAEQKYIDRLLTEQRDQDDADHKEYGRGKAGVLALSMAAARAAGAGLGLPLYRYLGGTTAPVMPVPVMSMIDGGDWLKGIDFKEIMIVPLNRSSFAEGLRMGAEVYQTLKRLLTLNGFDTSIGGSGGFAADMKSSEEALHYIMDAVRLSGYDPDMDLTAAICGNADDLYAKEEGIYRFNKESLKNGILVHRNQKDMISYYLRLADGFPLGIVTDGLWKQDLESRNRMYQMFQHRLVIASDDFFASNGVEIQLKKAGTVTAALEMIQEAKKMGSKVIVSNSDKETEEAFLGDMAVAAGADYIKCGAPCRGECTAKYNELLRIEEFYSRQC
ncbi:phosphopyruvate hydratase [Lacrimispora amygdalina]|uniref:Enolase n=2 Tax=Lacrimispora amygdalina TaxID=253257 RepID=A0A3E2N7V9_9FIRM|nr:phosphopyruvate hydratase [Clostridium indicum]